MSCCSVRVQEMTHTTNFSADSTGANFCFISRRSVRACRDTQAADPSIVGRRQRLFISYEVGNPEQLQGLEIKWFTLFCSTNLPLASTRWVQLTFSSHCPLSSNQSRWLTATTLISGTLGMGINPRAAGSRSKYANHCAMLLPPPPQVAHS